METPNDPTPIPAGRVDRVSAVLALATAVALAVLAYRQFRPEPIGEPPRIGSLAPPLALVDPVTGRPTLVLAEPGRVVWVTFWASAGAASSAETAQLERIWRRFRARRPFALIVATLDDAEAARLRTALAGSAPDLPIYVATPATRRAYGVNTPPLHFLIDEDGRVVAAVRGDGGNLEGMARQATDLLDAIEPPGGRFASRAGQPPGNAFTNAISLAGSRSGGPWPKQVRAGSSAASRRAASRFRAASVEKNDGGSCSPGHPVSGFMSASTSPAISTRSAARQ